MSGDSREIPAENVNIGFKYGEGWSLVITQSEVIWARLPAGRKPKDYRPEDVFVQLRVPVRLERASDLQVKPV